MTTRFSKAIPIKEIDRLPAGSGNLIERYAHAMKTRGFRFNSETLVVDGKPNLVEPFSVTFSVMQDALIVTQWQKG